MSEELVDEVQLGDYILKIFWGLPPEYAGYTRDICTIVILLKASMREIFEEQIHISETAEVLALNIIKDSYPDILKPPLNEENVIGNLMIKYVLKKAKERIKLGNFKEGETYAEEIMSDSVESWLHETKEMSWQ